MTACSYECSDNHGISVSIPSSSTGKERGDADVDLAEEEEELYGSADANLVNPTPPSIPLPATVATEAKNEEDTALYQDLYGEEGDGSRVQKDMVSVPAAVSQPVRVEPPTSSITTAPPAQSSLASVAPSAADAAGPPAGTVPMPGSALALLQSSGPHAGPASAPTGATPQAEGTPRGTVGSGSSQVGALQEVLGREGQRAEEGQSAGAGGGQTVDTPGEQVAQEEEEDEEALLYGGMGAGSETHAAPKTKGESGGTRGTKEEEEDEEEEEEEEDDDDDDDLKIVANTWDEEEVGAEDMYGGMGMEGEGEYGAAGEEGYAEGPAGVPGGAEGASELMVRGAKILPRAKIRPRRSECAQSKKLCFWLPMDCCLSTAASPPFLPHMTHCAGPTLSPCVNQWRALLSLPAGI